MNSFKIEIEEAKRDLRYYTGSIQEPVLVSAKNVESLVGNTDNFSPDRQAEFALFVNGVFKEDQSLLVLHLPKRNNAVVIVPIGFGPLLSFAAESPTGLKVLEDPHGYPNVPSSIKPKINPDIDTTDVIRILPDDQIQELNATELQEFLADNLQLKITAILEKYQDLKFLVIQSQLEGIVIAIATENPLPKDLIQELEAVGIKVGVPEWLVGETHISYGGDRAVAAITTAYLTEFRYGVVARDTYHIQNHNRGLGVVPKKDRAKFAYVDENLSRLHPDFVFGTNGSSDDGTFAQALINPLNKTYPIYAEDPGLEHYVSLWKNSGRPYYQALANAIDAASPNDIILCNHSYGAPSTSGGKEGIRPLFSMLFMDKDNLAAPTNVAVTLPGEEQNCYVWSQDGQNFQVIIQIAAQKNGLRLFKADNGTSLNADQTGFLFREPGSPSNSEIEILIRPIVEFLKAVNFPFAPDQARPHEENLYGALDQNSDGQELIRAAFDGNPEGSYDGRIAHLVALLTTSLEEKKIVFREVNRTVFFPTHGITSRKMMNLTWQERRIIFDANIKHWVKAERMGQKNLLLRE
ncbi:MAG: hypothetical protein AAGA80_03945 [Cyanobacteria bacterium P01_F01_bin.143]